ncbi:hypothetical protein FGIG_04066 [Fasciola gigantica]|uniref:Uncharacterized protein n=1 Tax=Fasciola gigantica TaxID=46835 RepID=A0A504ZAJ8_FASGI|nr:hypothetical protein FGIG_04066 [Fasciola gigantica]
MCHCIVLCSQAVLVSCKANTIALADNTRSNRPGAHIPSLMIDSRISEDGEYRGGITPGQRNYICVSTGCVISAHPCVRVSLLTSSPVAIDTRRMGGVACVSISTEFDWQGNFGPIGREKHCACVRCETETVTNQSELDLNHITVDYRYTQIHTSNKRLRLRCMYVILYTSDSQLHSPSSKKITVTERQIDIGVSRWSSACAAATPIHV